MLFGFDFDLPPKGAQISKVNEEHGVKNGYFCMVAFDYGLRFPLSILNVLKDYGIVPLQLVPNSWRIVGAFFLGCTR